MTWLEQYFYACEKKEIIIGQELMSELYNLMNDLDDSRFYYDTAEADLRISFMETFVKLTKSPFYGQPMHLMLWQKAFIETLYSFYWSETELQRFKRALLLIARKNTKSETCSALGLAEFMVGEPGADLVCSSNDDPQAKIIYDAINTMREMFDPKEELTHKNISKMTNKINGSSIFKLSDKTRNKEGRNIDWAILDESHEMKDNVIAKSILQSQSLKKNPKFINITTEGFVNDGYLDKELVHARAVINGEREDDALLPWLYTQDSETEIWNDRSSWVKSNPTLGTVKQWSYLDDEIAAAKYDKAARMFTLAKDFNIKQNNAQAWLMIEDYTYPATFDIEKFRGAVCVGAVDLSETTDLTCAKVLFIKDDMKFVHTQYFLPESKIGTDEKAGADYEQWIKDDLMTVSEGNDNDLTKVADWFYYLYKEFQIMPLVIGYDQRFAKEFLNRIDEYGFETEMILQNRVTMSNAMKLFEADLKSRRVNFNENPVDKWCLSNAAVSIDNLGQQMAVKINNEPEKRIDGAVTFIILYETYRRYRSDLKDAQM